MDAMTLIRELKSAGLALDVAPDGLHVTPKARITPELRERIRAHKAELMAALGPPPDDKAAMEADTAAQIKTADVIRLAAHPDRTAFAMKNHAEAVLHFRKMAAETAKIAAMYRLKVVEHIATARKRVTPAEFDAWQAQIGDAP